MPLFEGGSVRRKGCDFAGRLQHTCGDLFSERRADHLRVEDVVHRHGLRRDRPARVDEEGAAFIVQTPAPIVSAHHVLPANFTDIGWTAFPAVSRSMTRSFRSSIDTGFPRDGRYHSQT